MSQPPRDSLAKFLRALHAVERAVTFAAFTVMAGAVFADVVIRETQGSGWLYATPIAVWANVIVVLIGIGLASNDGAHLRPRFADGWVPKSFDPLMKRIQEAVFALFCFAFAWLCWTVVADSIRLKEYGSVLRILIWPIQAVMPLAFVLAGIRHAIYAIRSDLRPREHDEASDALAQSEPAR
jgi:TRAP-type C4-dicarboxylate transport system permease small subunit